MRIARKLGDVHQDLASLAEQVNITGFLTSAENVQRINGLVEDIREALLDYQVCVLNYLSPLCLTFMLDFIATRYLSKELSAYCKLPCLPFCLKN